MRGLASAVEFAEDAGEDGVLGIDETLEIDRVVGGVRPFALDSLPS
jgi:hypothetical protein